MRIKKSAGEGGFLLFGFRLFGFGFGDVACGSRSHLLTSDYRLLSPGSPLRLRGGGDRRQPVGWCLSEATLPLRPAQRADHAEVVPPKTRRHENDFVAPLLLTKYYLF